MAGSGACISISISFSFNDVWCTYACLHIQIDFYWFLFLYTSLYLCMFMNAIDYRRTYVHMFEPVSTHTGLDLFNVLVSEGLFCTRLFCMSVYLIQYSASSLTLGPVHIWVPPASGRNYSISTRREGHKRFETICSILRGNENLVLFEPNRPLCNTVCRVRTHSGRGLMRVHMRYVWRT